MAQDPKFRATARPPSRPDAIATALKVKLDDERHLLDSLVANLGRGQQLPELWALLHQAAQRDERVPQLAFAYERLTQDPKLKFLSGAVQSEILMHAATFFADVFSDLDVATGYLEQVLAVNPSHSEAFEKMESVLALSGNGLKLADVYAAAAAHRQDKDEQLRLFRRAAELADGFSEEHERAIKIYQSLLRIDPTDERVRRSLEDRLRQAGKHREVARLLEQVLSSSPGPAAAEAIGIRERLMALYAGDLGEPERALPHIEEILRDHPGHELARGTAHRLVSHKSVGGRAAALLADTYGRLGTYPEAAAMLEISLEMLRGPKRADVQKRLGVLKQDKLGDPAGAYLLFEAVVAFDPGDDEIRRRYGELARQLGKELDAARLLSRAATGVKELGLRARLGTEVGEIYLAAKDPKRARSAFASVVESAGGDDPAALNAARALVQLHAEANEHKSLAQMLELLSRIEPHETARCAAAERLGQLAEHELGDNPRAIQAWRSLLGSPLHDQALEALERLYAATQSYPELVDVLEKRVDLATNASAARALALRAAELRTEHTKDRARAIVAWIDFLGAYGSSREVHAKVIPLLEQEKRWDKLATILAEDVALAPEADRIPILLKLAQVRLVRLSDPRGAIDAYSEILAIDPKDPTTRQALEKLLAVPEGRIAAARLLEPAYRAEGPPSQLLRVLQIRAEGATDKRTSLSLYDEALLIADRDKHDAKRALELGGKALAVACHVDLGSVNNRLTILERLAAEAGDEAGYGALLSEALGDRPVDHPELAKIARRAGEALASAGDPTGALAVFRRALGFEPSSPELLAKIDGLLAEEGRPEERVVLYRAALAQATSPERRRELYHAIGTIERRDLGDPRAAIQTWRQALAENPSDRAAHAALLDAYDAAGEWSELYDELARALPSAHDPAKSPSGESDRRVAVLTKLGEVSTKMGDKARALAHYRELFEKGQNGDELVSAVEALAESSSDLAMLKEMFERRLSRATEPQETCTWLERLGDLESRRIGDLPKAASFFKRAAVMAESLLDEERARTLFERAFSAAPSDVEVAEHLFRLHARAELWDELPRVAKALVDNAGDDGEAVRRLLEFEPHILPGKAADTWLSLADGLLSKGVAHRDLAFARARVLATDPARHDDAAAQFRDLLSTVSGGDAGRIVDGFTTFLGKFAPAERKDDRRFVLAYKADHAPEAERVAALVAWAQAEESILGDPRAAAAVWRRVLSIEPERADALESLSRLLLSIGDVQEALETLTLLRESSEGTSRRDRDLEIAELCLTKLGRPEEALQSIASLVEAGPVDADALGIVYRVLEHPSSRESAAALLERAASGAEDDGQKLAILKSLLEMPKIPALEEARRRWFGSLLDLYESQPEVALDKALAAVAELPDDEALWGRAERLARALERPDLVAAAYRGALDRPLPSGAAAMLGKRAVDYQEEWFDDHQAVILLLRRVLDVAPEATWARDRLKLAYGSTERWDDLFALYDDAISRTIDEASRAELLSEAAQAAKDFASDADRAIGYYERFLTLRPNDARVRSLLERLYERQGRVEPLIDLLSQTLPSLAGEKAQSLRLRIAGLILRGRHDETASFKLIEDVLREDPRRADAFALLEQMVLGQHSEAGGLSPSGDAHEHESIAPSDLDGEASRGSSLPPASGAQSAAPPASVSGSGSTPPGRTKRKKRSLSAREKAASMLKERYHADGRYQELARVLEVELSLAASAKDQARRHHELLTLKLETLKDDNGAFEHAAALLALEPRVSAHRATLSELAERLPAWERLAETLVKTAESSSDAPLVARLLIEAAQIHRDKLAKDDRAIELFAAVLSLNPKDKDVALSTAHELDALLERAGRPEERCGVLEKIAALATEPGARRAALTELSRVASEQLRDPERAIRAWRAYISEGTGEIEALDGLISVLRSAERWPELVSALEARAEKAPAAQAREDWLEVAHLHGERLGAVDAAISAWSRVRQKFGAGQDTFVPLAQLFESLSRWDDLARLVVDETKSLVAGAGTPGIETRLLEMKVRAEHAVPRVRDRSLATHVCQELLEAGMACFVPPLSTDTSSEAAARWAKATWWALDELIRMALEEREHAVAAQRLLDGSKIVFDRGRARQMRKQAALVASEHLGDAGRAVDVYRELLAETENDAVAEAIIPELARLYAKLGAFSDLVDLWEHQAERHAPASRQISTELWTRAAELSEKRLSDLDRTIRDYERSAKMGSSSALRELARLHGKMGNPAKAAEALEGLSYQASQEHLVADTIALVDAYLSSGDRERARQRLEKAAEIAIQPRPLRARLREFYREDQDWTKLAELLRLEAEDAGDKSSRLRLLRDAADLHLTKRGDPGSAIPLLEQARKLDPDDHSIGLALTRALVATARPEEASVILRAELERYGNRKPKERALVHFELSRVSRQLGDRARALAELDLAAKIAPAHPGILHALGKLAAEEGQLDRAQRTFRALLLVLGRSDPAGPSEVGRAEVLFELAAIARRENDDDRADELIESAVHAATENEREAETFERALREMGSFDLLARSLEARLAGSANVETRVTVMRDLAALYGDHLGFPSDARVRLSGQAEQAMRELKEMTSASTLAWTALETVYERIGEPQHQAEILEHLATASGQVASPAYADALYRLAKLQCKNAETISAGVALLERAFDMDPRPDRAIEAVVSALEIDPKSERNVRFYEKISRSSGKGQEAARADALARLVELGVASADEQREAVVLALGASNDAVAESMLNRVLEEPGLDAAHAAWARTTLAELCMKSGDVARAADLAERAAIDAPADQRRGLLLEVAKAAMGPLKDVPRAARIYAALREREPADREIWAPLLEIYRKLQSTDELIALIAKTLPLIESVAERSRLRLEQATALLERPETENEAAALLREVLEDDPTQVDAAMLLSGLLERSGQSDELVALLERQLDAAKDRADVPSIVSLAMRLGVLLEERGRVSEALDVYRSAVEWDPVNKLPLYAVVRLSEARGDPFEIADALERVVTVETGEAAAGLAMRLFALRSEQGDVEGAERALEAGMRAHPTSVELSDLLIARYQTRGAYRELSALLRQAFDRAPDNLSLLRALLDAYRRIGAFDAARDVVTAALERAPNDASLYRERAALHEVLGLTTEALADFERAFAVAGTPLLEDYVQALKREAARAEPPDDRPIKLKLSQVLCATGFADAGRTYLAELLKRDAKDKVALRALAELEYREGRWDAASASYRRLLPLEDADALPETALRLADACAGASRLDDARSGLERALKAHPAHAAVRARLCDLYEKTGANGPLAELMLADASMESDVSGRFGLLMRAAALLLGPEGDAARAVGVLEEARTLRPEDDDGVLLLGRAYVTQGRTAEALALFQTTVLQRKGRRTKQLSAIHRELSRIRLQEGDLSAALEALTRAFDMDLHNGEIALELGLLAKDLDDAELAARAFRSVTFMKAAVAGTSEGASAAAKGLSYFFLGQMAREKGDVRKARLLAQKAVIEDPTLERARALLEELKSA